MKNGNYYNCLYGAVVQRLVRATYNRVMAWVQIPLALPILYADVIQLVECATDNRVGVGSSPTIRTRGARETVGLV